MSFLFGNSVKADRQPSARAEARALRPDMPQADVDRFYGDLIARRPALLDEKLKLHRRLIDDFNLALLDKLSPEELKRQVEAYVSNYVRAERISLNQKELDIFTNEVIAEMTGYGPIEPLLKDPTVSDILINTHTLCYVERFGKLERTNVRFKDEAHLLRIINKIVSAIGRRVDESSPMVDARLPDGSRVNVAVRPVAVDGPMVSIRKFAERPFNVERLIEVDTLRPAMAELLTGRRAGADFSHHLGRYRNREDDIAQCSLGLHSSRRTIDYDRGRCGTATATSACWTTGNSASQSGRKG